MTVSTETASVSYAGNGSTTVWAVPYYILEAAHIKVSVFSSLGVESVKTLNTNYTVSGAGTNPSTAQVTATTFTPATGETVVIKRDVPVTQETDYVENDAFPAESHEKALDKLTMIIQQQDVDISKALRLPITTAISTLMPEPSANQYPKVNAGKTAFEWVDASVSVPAGEDIIKVTNIATMKALTGLADGALIQTLGYYAAGDGGHGSYRYNAAGAGTANGGTVHAPDTLPGRFELLHNGWVSLKQFGVKSDGVTDNSAAITAAFAARIPLYDDGGTYVIQTSVAITSLATSTFNQGPIFYGAGIGKTIFDNQVSSAPMFDIAAGGTPGTNFLMGLCLKGFKVIRSTSETAQAAIRLKTSYMVSLEQIHIIGMTGDGIRIPCLVGDNDGSNMVSMKQVRVENCSGWGIDLAGASGFNETSFIYMEHCFVQGCGTTDGAYQPPSGGVKWKGQILTMQQCAFTLNENCALWIPGEAGAAQTVDLQDTTFENNKNRSLFCRGVSRFKARNVQFYNNDSFTSTVACEFEGDSFVIRGIEIDGVVVRATAGNNPYTAFKISGANTDLNSCRVRNVVWDNFDFTGQTRFNGWQFDYIENNLDLVADSGTSLLLRPRTSKGRGNKVPLRLRGGVGGAPSTTGEWIAHQVSNSGLSISNASLAINTTYYCYIYDNNGAAALELSTTAWASDAGTGYPVKSGDATRYYVGTTRTDGASLFLTAAAGWLNPDIFVSGSQTGVAVYMWSDSTTRLRIKYATAPTSDTDGTIVGTQL